MPRRSDQEREAFQRMMAQIALMRDSLEGNPKDFIIFAAGDVHLHGANVGVLDVIASGILKEGGAFSRKSEKVEQQKKLNQIFEETIEQFMAKAREAIGREPELAEFAALMTTHYQAVLRAFIEEQYGSEYKRPELAPDTVVVDEPDKPKGPDPMYM